MYTIKDKTTWDKTFTVFVHFLQTTKVFPTNFITAILSPNIYAKSCFRSCPKQNCKFFPTL